jgi:hypothetical protein
MTGGGGALIESPLELVDSEVSGNEAPSGGGIMALTDLVLRRTTVAGNRAVAPAAGGVGGGLLIGGGVVTIADSTLHGNEATGRGGGLFHFGGALLVEQSTVSGNRAPDGGGGLHLETSPATAILWSTVTGNAAGGPGGGIAIFNAGASVTGSIVGANEPDDCVGAGATLVSAGHNLQGDGSCPLGAPTDRVGAPLLGALADNGGPTATHALLPGSPALDLGGGLACPAADQRGVPRPQGAACDAGAVERRAPTAGRPAPATKPVDPR